MGKKRNIDLITEWAVWANLHPKVDLVSLLLKGHLLLEVILNEVLRRNKIHDYEYLSFYRKITLLDEFVVCNEKKKNFIVSTLKDINSLRNKIAHELNFDIRNGDFADWAKRITNNLEGEKFTRYTFRTRIQNSFSILSINLLGLKDKRTKIHHMN